MDRHLVALLLAIMSLWSACSAGSSQRIVAGYRPTAAAGDTGSGSAGAAGLDRQIGTPSSPSAAPTTTVENPAPPGIPVVPTIIDHTGADNPAGLPADAVKKLIEGGPPGTMRWLYPYEGTVFPRGMQAPAVMWEGETPEAVYVRVQARAFDYRSVLKPGLGLGVHTAFGTSMVAATSIGVTTKPQVQFPQEIWEKAGEQAQGRADPFTLELSALVNGQVAGPIVRHFIIAPAIIKGAIYYNSYMSETPGANLLTQAKVVRIRPGATAELVSSGNTCTGCHSISADGSRMIAQTSPGGVFNSGQVFTGQGLAYQLTPAGAVDPMTSPAGPRASFGALYPDGSKYLSTSLLVEVGQASLWQSLDTAPQARLYDTATGQVVPDAQIPVDALMPMFSPDGKRLVFNDYAINTAHGLAVMDYDTTNHRASNHRKLTQDDAASGWRPGWPAFLPDNKAVVFVRTNSADFTAGFFGGVAAIGAAQLLMDQTVVNSLPASDLHIVDVASSTQTILARAMGFDTPADAVSGRTYLPFGAADLHKNYLATVSPVAAGGYFWVFFDSVRNFGNLGLQRQLWGTAVEIRPDGDYTSDPSHPPFYLSGQEFGADNFRALAVLDRCKENGEPCTSGIDCCVGACPLPSDASAQVCAPPPPNGCAKRDERCLHDADCCPPQPGQPSDICIGGYCAYVEVW